jgi:hypothetical protein
MRSEGTDNWERVGEWIAEGSPAKTTAKKKISATAGKKRAVQKSVKAS